MEVSEKAVHNFVNDSFNCSEGIVAAISEKNGYPQNELISMASAFGGGIGSTGNICGALTGGLMMLGKVAKEKNFTKPEIREKAKSIYDNFENKFNSVNCSSLTNHVCSKKNEPFDIKMCSPFIKFVVNEVVSLEKVN